jgi:mannose-1-phosphate guanylyltransferase / mannose-6-phosphate isomerase
MSKKVGENLLNFTISESTSLKEVLIKMNLNKKGFLIVVSDQKKVLGVITDGDIRRLFLEHSNLNSSISFNNSFNYLKETDGFDRVCELFKSSRVTFLPICNDKKQLVNLITKKQFHTLLLHDMKWDLTYNFSVLNESEIDHEVYNKPWGFYKSTMLLKYVQSKIITVFPGEELSLQEHRKREEHWIIIKGNGKIILGGSKIEAFPGQYIFIPKETKHKIINDGSESIIFSEIQLGEYFGEDDIIRHSDKYGRIDKIR